jgi:glycosyltransferase involved in cell wall biosynthesis
MIDLLVPVLGRPHRVVPFLESIAATTDVEHHILFLCSKGDKEEIAAVKASGHDYLVLSAPPAQGQYAKKINLGFRETSGEWIFAGADDIAPQPGWAKRALVRATQQICVIGTDDRANYFVRQGLLAVHPLIRRTYIEEYGGSLDGPGSIYHEGYSHNFVDCEFTVLARHRRVFVFERHSVIRHLHPVFKTAPMDSTYEVGLRDFDADRRLFCERMEEYRHDRLVRRFWEANQKLAKRDR